MDGESYLLDTDVFSSVDFKLHPSQKGKVLDLSSSQ